MHQKTFPLVLFTLLPFLSLIFLTQPAKASDLTESLASQLFTEETINNQGLLEYTENTITVTGPGAEFLDSAQVSVPEQVTLYLDFAAGCGEVQAPANPAYLVGDGTLVLSTEGADTKIVGGPLFNIESDGVLKIGSSANIEELTLSGGRLDVSHTVQPLSVSGVQLLSQDGVNIDKINVQGDGSILTVTDPTATIASIVISEATNPQLNLNAGYFTNVTINEASGGTVTVEGAAAVQSINAESGSAARIDIRGGRLADLNLYEGAKATVAASSGEISYVDACETYEGTIVISGATMHSFHLQGGTVDIQSMDCSRLVDLTVDGAEVSVSCPVVSSGRISVQGGKLTVSNDGSISSGNIIVMNDGEMALAGGSLASPPTLAGGKITISKNNASLATTALNLISGELEIAAPDVVLNNGTLTIPDGVSVLVSATTAESFVVDGGSLTIGQDEVSGEVEGTIEVNDGELNIAGGQAASAKASDVTISGGTVTLGTNGTIDKVISMTSGTLDIANGTIASDFEASGGDIIASTNKGMIYGSVTLSGSASLDAKTGEDHAGLTIMGSLVLKDSSTLYVEDSAVLQFILSSGTCMTLEGDECEATIEGFVNGAFGTDTTISVTAGTLNVAGGQIDSSAEISILQTGGEIIVGKAATVAGEEATGPTIYGKVDIQSGKASLLGGTFEKDVEVNEQEGTSVAIGTPAKGSAPASGPTFNASWPEETNAPYCIVYFANGEVGFVPENEPEHKPTPPSTPTKPTPSEALAKIAESIKNTIDPYAALTYSLDYMNWNIQIRDKEELQSALAKDFIAPILSALATTGATSVSTPVINDPLTILTSDASRIAFGGAFLRGISGDKTESPTLNTLFGKIGEIDVTMPSGKVLVLNITFATKTASQLDTVVVWRLYNPYLNGAHLLTIDANEVEGLKSLGWQDEGERFTQYAEPGTDTIPVFRLYNPNNGDHFFTAQEDEAETLESIGWKREGIAWYAPQVSEFPAYRLYNPYQTEFGGLGNHLWTTDVAEKNYLVDLGWQDENIGWYTMPLVPLLFPL